MISTVIAAATNVVLNYFGIKAFGYQVAAYTTLIAYVIHALIQGIISTKVCHTITTDMTGDIYNSKMIIVLAAFTIFGCLLCIPLYENIWLRYAVVVIILIGTLAFRKQLLKLLKLNKR